MAGENTVDFYLVKGILEQLLNYFGVTDNYRFVSSITSQKYSILVKVPKYGWGIFNWLCWLCKPVSKAADLYV